MDALVDPSWLAAELGARDLAVLDATLVAADTGRDPAAAFAAGHVPGARFLALATLRDRADPLPNMLPSHDAVAARLGRLGVDAGDRIVLYDDSPWHTAARAWFVLRRAGFARVALLDGGLARWRAAGQPLATGDPAPPPPGAPPPRSGPGPGAVRDLAAMRANLASGAEQVVDARSAARFAGTEADPHGAAPGHIPGALNLPYARLFAPDGRWLRGAALAAAFAAAGVDIDRPVVATCGSGITAAVLLFGLHLLGRDGALYDASWAQWGAAADTPKAVAAPNSGKAIAAS